MDGRVFLGWDEPLLGLLVDWLWERRGELPGMLVVVPTAQSGRRLREALAERGGCLAPKVVTPGALIRTEQAAPPAAEVLAWVEALEGVVDWGRYANVFPSPPGQDEASGWALPLANSLMSLERALQEAGLTPDVAARRLGKSVEGERWRELGELWRVKEAMLSKWGLVGRSRTLEQRMNETPEGRIVLAGVPDLPEAAVRRLRGAEVVCLVAAPEGEAFDEFGRPDPESWKERAIAWPEAGSVELTADPRQQARQAVARVAAAGTASDELALGSADEETAEELVRAFGREGWTVHNPAGGAVSRVRGWLSLWRAWLARPEVATAIDLLGMEETAALTGGMRMRRVEQLSAMRDRGLVRTGEDVQRLEAAETACGRMPLPPLAAETMERLGAVRGAFLRQPFGEAMGRLLERVDAAGKWDEVRDWLTAMEPVIGRVRRDAAFWIDLLVAGLSEGVKEAPDGRVVDVQGWLELLHEPGAHLVVCGMNEGRVPAAPATDAWLSEGVRELLGLTTDARRAARDAYVLTALTEARKEGGRVDLLLAKSSADGDALLPSRLLLAASGEELARRVELLFAEIEPPDAGMKWEQDWAWRVPTVELKPRLSVTALRDYLACPLRFYLKHGVAMYSREPERVEWNARDFGNVVHAVLENWGRHEEVREFSKSGALEEWLHAELERVVAEKHGDTPPLAVRIQVEGARQRLSWFARLQACERAAGWRVEAVEEKFEREVAGVTLVGKVDRIDRHDDGRRRVLDYKTYNALKDVEKDHRVGVTAATVLPPHLEGVEAVIGTNAKGKPVRWTNLQVPIYSMEFGEVDAMGYVVLGATEDAVGVSLWEGFSEADRDSALACAEWVIGRVKARVFWPPAERVQYDDFALLGCGRPLAEMVEEVKA
ncbi:PD-(D/E)XK nuclease family protein [Haloferula sp. A504]|uniref:PD-(D/E)XK nuclease family protein n=1 Tax=Haloferula sp. A504 TaxID=3373601 RepID=UPI0031CBB14E|nr:PD-(D/E)XK nuclease family protein [Verrucomicrobiaceae bacterium E54]